MSLAETTSDRVSLEIPLDPAHLLITRVFAGGVARSLDLDEETADVLRLALTEICSGAIDRRRDGRIVIDVSVDTIPIRVNVVATGAIRGETPVKRTESPYRLALIQALVPDTTIVEDEGSLSAMFTL